MQILAIIVLKGTLPLHEIEFISLNGKKYPEDYT